MQKILIRDVVFEFTPPAEKKDGGWGQFPS